MRPRIALPVIVLVVLAGCSNNPRHQLAVSSQVVAASLFAAQDAENALFAAQRITPAQHQRLNQHLVVALTLGREFNTAIRAWDQGQPLPSQLEKLKAVLLRITAELSTGYPDDVRVQLLSTITATYDAILAVLAAAAA